MKQPRRCVCRSALAFLTALAAVCAGEEQNRLLPFGKERAGDQKLPLPFGIGLTVHRQNQGYAIRKLNLQFETGIPGMDLSQVSGVEVDNELLEVDGQFDIWILPFLNLFALVGNIEGETSVGGPVVESFLGNSLLVEYEGIVYGCGATLAGAWKRLFASLTYTYTDTNLDQETSSVRAWVLTPKIGLANERGAIWVGAMYQAAEEQQRGRRLINLLFPVPAPVRIEYDVELEQKQAWNYLGGICTTLGEHWQIQLEGGFGERKQATLSTTYRF
ncbi:MAG: hypothetical protein N2255_06160 [Kiritimatiellae bacterium]|nr:hypothetical protein [Kiritimatiellia bacterium]